MKKLHILFSLLTILTLALAACSSTNLSGAAQNTTSVSTQAASLTTSSSANTQATGGSAAQTEVAPVGGNAPSGAAPGNPPPGTGGGAQNADQGLATASGAYTHSGGSQIVTDQTYTATAQDQSGVYVTGGSLILNNVSVQTSGSTSSDENSSFFGLNAGVLATNGASLSMNSGSITTSGAGANGAFATGSGTQASLSNVTITASGDGGHGVMATQGGSMTLDNVNMTTSGAHSAPIATDRGGGVITASGGTLNTSGQDSPCYYSTGTLDITNSTCNAAGSEIAVIEGANTILLKKTTAVSSVADKWGVMIYQSFSGDAQGSDGIFTMSGGSLSYTANGPLFYVTNTTAHITLNSVIVSAASGVLLKAAGNDRWGGSGSNGGLANMVADGQTLNGSFVVDAISSLSLSLQNSSSLTGAINAENNAKIANLTLDASSMWVVTADSYLTSLSDPAITAGSVPNITGNGHTVYYNLAACPALNGQTYTLAGGGTLTPIS